MLTRKNYVVFAWLLVKNIQLYRSMDLGEWETEKAEAFRFGASHALMKMQADMEVEFAHDNPNFSRDKFRKYIRENTR